MRRFLVLFGALLCGSAVFGMQGSMERGTDGAQFFAPKGFNPKGFNPKGDTDQYGYYFWDSNDPGGPVYSWIDITTTGIEVTGLSDDNNSGPFEIGFEFPYYWYKVDQFWVNSNGAISFSSPDVYFPQETGGNNIPNTVPPNDLVIPLGADLSFGSPSEGKCYYWTNNIDTLIVSFIDVPAWTFGGLAGAHTSQLILVANDSTILFQYGKQEGSFYQNMDCAGIENVAGNVGLQYLKDIMPDSGLAVKFIPPESTSYEAQDVGVYEAISDGSEGIFLFPDEPESLFVTVKNCGNVDIGSFDVYCEIREVMGPVVYADTITVPGLVSGEMMTEYFDPWVPPVIAVTYTAEVKVDFPGDINPINDNRIVELKVMTYPGWLMFDSDPQEAQASYWYGAGGGWGQEFRPPTYPTIIESVQVALSTTDPVNVPILFMDDDRQDGGPGTIMHAETLNITPTGGFNWYTIAIPSCCDTINEGKFYVGMIQLGDSFPMMIIDPTPPHARRAWECTGTWAPYRMRDSVDLMIRAYARHPGEELEELTGSHFKVKLFPISPNPASSNIRIRYSISHSARGATSKVSLKVYNLIGQVVRTLVNEPKKPGVYTIELADKLPSGIYFARLVTDELEATRKFIILR